MNLNYKLIISFLIFLTFSLFSKETLKISTNGLRLRSLPSSNSDIIAKLNKKSKLVFIERSGVVEKIDGFVSEWIKIEVAQENSKTSGYIFGGYVYDSNNKRKFIKCIESEKGFNIFFENGNSIYLKNVDSDDYDTHISYSDCKYFKELNALVVSGSLYEGEFFKIYNMKNGENYNIWGEPIFSIQNKYFASISADIEANYNPNGLQIFKAEFPLKKEFEYSIDVSNDADNFQPIKVKWISESRLELLAENNKSKTKKYIFEKVNSNWKLNSK